MHDDVVLYEVLDRVAVLTLNRPEQLNAWTPTMRTMYFDYLDRAGADPDVRAVVVTGAGRGFCAGADLEILEVGRGVQDVARPSVARDNTFPLSVPKLMVAAINGPCAGVGLLHSLMCDVRFAATGAKFSTAFARRGHAADPGISWVLPRIVGTSAAMDLLLSARVFLTDEALAMGLINRACEPEALLEEALAYARDVARSCSPAAVAAIKATIYRHWATDVATATAEATEVFASLRKGSDAQEGVASFLERRTPDFSPLPKSAG